MGQMILSGTGTITSKELVEQINMFRSEIEGKSEIHHKTLLDVIREEFEEEIGRQEILPSEYINSQNKKQPMFNLTISQAKQVLVRESKVVRKAVIKRLDDLESKQVQAPLVIDSSYMMQIAIQMKEIEDQRDEAIRTKGQISDRKTATAMANSAHANNKVRKLEAEIESMKTKQLKATDLGKLIGVSAREMNKRLAINGYQVHNGVEWVVTPKGMKLCSFDKHIVEHASGARTHYTTLWNQKVLEEMNIIVDEFDSIEDWD